MSVICSFGRNPVTVKGLPFLGIKSIKGKIAFISVGLICTVFILTVVFPLLPEDVRERYSIETVAEDKGSGRFEIWKYLIEYTTG